MNGVPSDSVPPGRLREMMRRLLPAAAVVHTLGASKDGPVSRSSHPAHTSDSESSPARRFDRGRACARRALTDLGAAELAVGRGPRREPLWPGGFVGSITHVAGLSAAAVGPTTHLQAIGIDAESNDPLPAGVEELVVTDGSELSAVGRPASPLANWPTVLFSAKESVYKAWYPAIGRWLDFHDIYVELSFAASTSGGFRVTPGTAHPMSPAEAQFLGELTGRFEVDPVSGLVATTAVVIADPTG